MTEKQLKQNRNPKGRIGRKGVSRVHSIAAYDRTWERFQAIKRHTSLSTNQLLETLLENNDKYKAMKNPAKIGELEKAMNDANAVLSADFKVLKDHYKEYSDNIRKEARKLNGYEE